ncbi:MAG: hypothetical protein WD273_05130 [Trueperaceae bacterium]
MNGRRVVAYVLIGAGSLALLARVGPDTGWLWVAVAAAGFLAAYRQQGTYAFLVVGGVLAGVAGGLLLEGAWRWPGAFLMSLGAGFLVIDRVEPKPSRWPIYPAAVLVGVGLVYWLFRAGIVQSLWFPFLLIIGGIYLLRRRETSGWVEVGEEVPESEPPLVQEPSAGPAGDPSSDQNAELSDDEPS